MKALKIIANILLWIFVILAALITIMAFTTQNNNDRLPNIFGKSLVTVQSDSMKPVFAKGDLIIVQTLSTEEKSSMQVGDIITYRTDINNDGIKNEFNTHKIINIRSDGGYVYYDTKGENNEIADQIEVRYDEIVGKYTENKIPAIGSALDFLRKPEGFLICVVIPLILFFLYELYRFIVIIAGRHTKKLTTEEEDALKKKAVEEYLATQNSEQQSEDVPKEVVTGNTKNQESTKDSDK